MADWDDVRRIVASLPETHEDRRKSGELTWSVRDKSLAWERPLRKGDIAALGEAAPDGDILGVRVPDLGAKEAVLRDNNGAIFTIPHFANYPAVLVEMDNVDLGELEELIVEAWLSRAPKRLRDRWSRPAS